MKYTAAILAALAVRVSAGSQSAAEATPQVSQPEGEDSSECQQSFDGPFKLTIVEEKMEKREMDQLEVSHSPPLRHRGIFGLLPLHSFPHDKENVFL